MPQPNATNPFTIIISQRNSTGTFFQEKYVSGSNLRLETDASGNIVGVAGGGASGKFTGSFTGSANLSSLTASAIRIIGTNSGKPLVFARNNDQTITKTGAGDFYITNTVSGGKVYLENSYFLENDLVVPGDVAINGGDITTTATDFNLATGASGQITIGGASTKVYIPGTLRASVISESVIHITSSQVDIGDNIIRVNALFPFKKYAGLEAIDSGSSPRVTASVLWNSETNTWFINHKNSNKVTSSYIIVGPKSGNFGEPKPLESNKITKGTPGGLGNEITSSKLTDDGTTLTYFGSHVSLPALTASSVTVSGVANFVGNTTLGDSSSDTLTVGAKSTFTAPITASSIRVTGVANFVGDTTLGDSSSDTLTVGAKSTFTAPITASSIRVTGKAELTASYSTTASIANKVVITNKIVSLSDHYLTFVDGFTGNRTVNVDSNKLIFTPTTNTLTVGPATSGSIVVGDTTLAATNKITIASAFDVGGASINIGTAVGNVSSSLGVGTNIGGNFFNVQTYKSLLVPNGVSTNLVFTSSNTTQATNYNNGALSTMGGVGIAKDLRVSGSIAGYTVITGSVKTNNFVFDDLKGNISTYIAGGSTNGRIPSSSLDRIISGKGGFSLVTGSLRVDDQFLYIFTGVHWKRVALQSFNI